MLRRVLRASGARTPQLTLAVPSCVAAAAASSSGTRRFTHTDDSHSDPAAVIAGTVHTPAAELSELRHSLQVLTSDMAALQQQHNALLQHLDAQGALRPANTAAGAPGGKASDANYVPAHVLRTVVKIFAAVAAPNHILPWQRKLQTAVSGTGFVVDRQRRLIMTNCHVIGKATSIQVRRHGAGHRHVAETVFIAADCDIALLHVDDDAFWADAEEAVFENSAVTAAEKKEAEGATGEQETTKKSVGGLNALCALGPHDAIPDLQASVKVVGFPWGGDQVSITSGVVSRVDMTSYGSADGALLGIQIDAAINSGNSGGPALVDSKVVGIAFQTLVAASNIGYLIPACVAAVAVRYFFAGITERLASSGVDEHVRRVVAYHNGFTSVGIGFQDLTNATLRAKYGLVKSQSGCLVEHVFKRTSAEGHLKAGDVLTSVNGFSIADDATVQWKPDQRVCFSHFVRCTRPGDTFALGIIRDGSEMVINVPAKVPFALIPTHTYTERYLEVIPYRVFGGCVFTELTMGYLLEWGDPDWINNAPRFLTSQLYPRLGLDDQRDSVVVLSQILPHAVNRGYSSDHFTNRMVHQVNGETVCSFEHFHSLLNKACRSDEPVTMLLSNGSMNLSMVMKPSEAKQADESIREAYGLPTLVRHARERIGAAAPSSTSKDNNTK